MGFDIARYLGFSTEDTIVAAPADTARLAELETVIERGLAAYAAAGRALTEIKQKQLYRATHRTFDEYLAARWKMDTAHAYRLMSAAEVASNLSPIGDIPSRESIARPLTRLPAEQQPAAWQEAKALAGGEPKAHQVAEVVAKRLPKKRKSTKLAKPLTIRVPGACIRITPNKAFSTYESALVAALEMIRSRNAA